MFKPFALAFFVAFFVWVGAIVISTDPHERMHRAALPIALIGKATVAVVVQIEPEWAASTYNFFLQLEYGFKYTIWSVFYEEEWRTSQTPITASAPPGPAAASAPSKSPPEPARRSYPGQRSSPPAPPASAATSASLAVSR
jgi:hypothetical protein